MTDIDIAARLRQDEALRREGVELVVDAILERRLDQLVDVCGLRDLLVAAFHSGTVARAVELHLEPAYQRLRARCEPAESGPKVGDFVPESVREELEALVSATPLPRFAWAHGAVDSALLRDLFAPALRSWLLMFVKKVPGLGGGLAGALSKVGGRAGKRAISAVDERVQATAESFSRSASDQLQEAVAERLASEEGQALAAEIRRQAFAHVLATPVGAILEDLEGLPRREMEALLPAIVEGNARSTLGHTLLRQEIEAYLAVEGARTLRAALEDATILPQVRAYLRVQGEALVDTLLVATDFGDWLARVAQARHDSDAAS